MPEAGEAPALAQHRRSQARVVAQQPRERVQRGGVLVQLHAALAQARPLQGSDRVVVLLADVVLELVGGLLPVLGLDELGRGESCGCRA